jgi:hypothetical protein
VQIKTLNRKLALTLVVALIAALTVPTIASAQQVSPTDRQYKNTLTQVGGGVAEQPNQPTALEQRVGPLPFTGFDVIAMVTVALAVTGLGLGLQRAVSRGDQTT